MEFPRPGAPRRRTLIRNWRALSWYTRVILLGAWMSILGVSFIFLVPLLTLRAMPEADALSGARKRLGPLTLDSALAVEWAWGTQSMAANTDTVRWRSYLQPSLPPALCGDGAQTPVELARLLGNVATISPDGAPEQHQASINALRQYTPNSTEEAFLQTYGIARAYHLLGQQSYAAAVAMDPLGALADTLAPPILQPTDGVRGERGALGFYGQFLRGRIFLANHEPGKAYSAFRRAINAVYYQLSFDQPNTAKRVVIPSDRVVCRASANGVPKELTSVDGYVGLVAAYIPLNSTPVGVVDELKRHRGELGNNLISAYIRYAQSQVERGTTSESWVIPARFFWAASNAELVHRTNPLDSDPRLEASRATLALLLANQPSWREAAGVDSTVLCQDLSRVQSELSSLVLHQPQHDLPLARVFGALLFEARSAQTRQSAQGLGRGCIEAPNSRPDRRVQEAALRVVSDLVGSGLPTRFEQHRQALKKASTSDRAAAEWKAVESTVRRLDGLVQKPRQRDAHAWARRWREAVHQEVAQAFATWMRSESEDVRVAPVEARERLEILYALVRHSGSKPSELHGLQEFRQLTTIANRDEVFELRWNVFEAPVKTLVWPGLWALLACFVFWVFFVTIWRVRLTGWSHYRAQRERLERRDPRLRERREGRAAAPLNRSEEV